MDYARSVLDMDDVELRKTVERLRGIVSGLATVVEWHTLAGALVLERQRKAGWLGADAGESPLKVAMDQLSSPDLDVSPEWAAGHAVILDMLRDIVERVEAVSHDETAPSS